MNNTPSYYMSNLMYYLSNNPEVYIFANPFKDILPKIPTFFTENISRLGWDDITWPVMKCEDKYNRCYIIIKILVNKRKIIQIFYQKFINMADKWGDYQNDVNLACLSPKFIHCSNGIMTHDQIKLIKDIISNKDVEITMKHECSHDIIGKYQPYINCKEGYIFLMSKREIDASLVIQRFWHQCRYNPRYKVCRKIQFRKFDNILKYPVKFN